MLYTTDHYGYVAPPSSLLLRLSCVLSKEPSCPIDLIATFAPKVVFT